MARSLTSWLLFLGAACASGRVPSGNTTNGASADATAEPLHEQARARMVAEQLEARGIHDPRVLAAMRDVPRHQFVPPDVIAGAYEDTPLPIGHDQTISQPYIVALMTELARPKPTDKALEIGTGSGYQTAVLSGLVRHVYTIEYVPALAEGAAKRLATYANVTVREGDGYHGWREEAPFDIILVTAAPETVPPPLVEQLAIGGRLVIPVGATANNQMLQLMERRADGSVSTEDIAPVRFVPLRH